MTHRSGQTRSVLLVAGIVAVLAVGGYAAYRSSLVRSWFERERVNAPEVDRLRNAPPRSAPAAEATAGWPQWRGPRRDGVAPAGPLRTDWDGNPPTPVWSAPCGGGYSSIAVVGGRAYTQDRQGGDERVFCLDAGSGQLLWEHRYPADYARIQYAAGPRATPAVDGDRVYAVGATGKFLCLEPPAAAGQPPRVVWEHDLPAEFEAAVPHWGVASSPLVDGDQVVVIPGGKRGAVAAFDKATGVLRWAVGSNPAGYSSPVAATVGGVRLVYALTGNALLCVRADGQLMWDYDWKTDHLGNIATPVVHDDYVFISSAYNKGCALLRAEPDGDRVRRVEVYYHPGRSGLKTHHATAVLKDGYLYGFDGDSRAALKCFEFATGKEIPGWEADGLAKGSLILAGDHLLVLTEGGELALVEAGPAAYRLVATAPSGLGRSEIWALPVLVGGRLYLRDGQKVLCLEVGKA